MNLQGDLSIHILSHPVEVGGDINNDIHQHLRPWRIPSVLGELSWLPILFCIVFVLFVVQKLVLCGSEFCVGSMYWVVWESQLGVEHALVVPGGLAYWAGVAPGHGVQVKLGGQFHVIMPYCSRLLPLF